MAGLAKQAGLKLECQMEKKTRWNPSKEVEIYPAIKGHKCTWYALNITKHYIKQLQQTRVHKLNYLVSVRCVCVRNIHFVLEDNFIL